MDDDPFEGRLERPPFAAGMKWWTCSYQRDGNMYAVDIPALTREDAETALLDQFGGGSVDGELEGVVRLTDDEARRIVGRFRPPA